MELQVPCSKGCGHNITLSQAQLDVFAAKGQSVVASHDVCPPAQDHSAYKVVIVCTKHSLDPEDKSEPEVLWSAGKEIVGPTLKDVWPEIVGVLSDQVAQVGAMAESIEQEPGDEPATQEEG